MLEYYTTRVSWDVVKNYNCKLEYDKLSEDTKKAFHILRDAFIESHTHLLTENDIAKLKREKGRCNFELKTFHVCFFIDSKCYMLAILDKRCKDETSIALALDFEDPIVLNEYEAKPFFTGRASVEAFRHYPAFIVVRQDDGSEQVYKNGGGLWETSTREDVEKYKHRDDLSIFKYVNSDAKLISCETLHNVISNMSLSAVKSCDSTEELYELIKSHL